MPQYQGKSDGGGWQRVLENGRIECTLCPRTCQLLESQRGFCFARQRNGDRIELTSYGVASGFCIDPIEKKPLNHFYPGTSVLSFGTAGCNLGCRFCQNWDISKARDVARTSSVGAPDKIAEAAQGWGCAAVAFTYNDPVIFAEYAMDTALACRTRDIRTVAVTAGYISPGAREPFFDLMDAANIDLKAFTNEFYRRMCAAEIAPVLETIKYVRHHTQTWLELTTLLIPGHNDSEHELTQMLDWILGELGPDVPLHFTAFHPDYRLTEVTSTPVETCLRARELALYKGVHHVYTGNIADPSGQATYCPNCRQLVIGRDGYRITRYALDGVRCHHCQAPVGGRYSDTGPGQFGPRRLAITIPTGSAQK